MPELIDSASAILFSSEMRVRSTGQDIANASTAGYKQRVDFLELIQDRVQSQAAAIDGARDGSPSAQFRVDFAQGRLTQTDRSLDFAIFGPGLLSVREGEEILYTRGGSFARGPEGVLADSGGRVLQQAGGGDFVVSGGRIELLDDGTVLDDGLPIGRLSLVEFDDSEQLQSLGGTVFKAHEGAMREAEGSSLRQGYLESSNVQLGDEVVALMAASRQAESGARIAQYYDQLLGQAISTFSGAKR